MRIGAGRVMSGPGCHPAVSRSSHHEGTRDRVMQAIRVQGSASQSRPIPPRNTGPQDRARPRPLPGRWRDLLRDGDVTGRYDADHAAVMAVAVAAVRAGWSEQDYVLAMSDLDNRLADYYRLSVASPQTWIALLVFLTVALLAGQQTGNLLVAPQGRARR